MSTNKNLYDFCRWNETERVVRILNNFKDIDVLYENGSFFDFAISKNNSEICKALLDYFENKQFPVKNVQYQEEKSKLIEILENATDSVELSIEMKNILSPYINFESSEDDRLNDSFFNRSFNIWYNNNMNKNNIFTCFHMLHVKITNYIFAY